jgi:S-formylglutathione hydrolase
MIISELEHFVVEDPIHGQVPCAAVVPPSADSALPLCLFLYGGGGSVESLHDMQPLLEQWWASGALAPMVVATPDVGPYSFYLDDPARGQGWESFVATRFIEQLRVRFDVASAPCAIVGISMGGYGALKIALTRSAAFGAVAALTPMLEPAFEAADVHPRNRFHYPAAVPDALLGSDRDPALYRHDHPAGRARQHADALRRSELGIYIDAAGADALHAHDGAEFLHRVLWDLDIVHEYRLRRDADHIGPGLLERLYDAFAWVAARVAPSAPEPLSDIEHEWARWLDTLTTVPTGAGSQQPPATALSPNSRLAPRLLRAHLAPRRREAELRDATTTRRYGLLDVSPRRSSVGSKPE